MEVLLFQTHSIVCVLACFIFNYFFLQKLPLFIALFHVTFQSLNLDLKLFFVHENIKKLASKVAYFSFCLAVLVLPKSARSAQTVENPHSFSNVSYT